MNATVTDTEALAPAPEARLASPEQRTFKEAPPIALDGPNGRAPVLDEQQLSDFMRAALFERRLSKSDPVKVIRDSLLNVYEALGQTIEKGSRATAGMGFKAEVPDSVLLDDLNNACSRMVKRLGPIITTPALNEQMVTMQTLAKDLNAAFLGFRLFLTRKEFIGGIPEDKLEVVIQELINFQRMISEPMNFLMSLSHGVVVQPQAAGGSEAQESGN